jgi:hypothetical protein
MTIGMSSSWVYSIQEIMDELKDNIVDKVTTLEERPVNVQMRQLLYNIGDIHDTLVKRVIHPKLDQIVHKWTHNIFCILCRHSKTRCDM